MADIREWRVEDPQFWETTGKGIANRNLWISISQPVVRLRGVDLLEHHYRTDAQCRISVQAGGVVHPGGHRRSDRGNPAHPIELFIRIAGGRNTIVFTTALLMIPALGTGIALQSKGNPVVGVSIAGVPVRVWWWQFRFSMSNISFFFPKRMQGLALGLNAGLGNAGVTTMQILVPLVMTFPLLGSFGGEPVTLVQASGSLIGKIPPERRPTFRTPASSGCFCWCRWPSSAGSA